MRKKRAGMEVNVKSVLSDFKESVTTSQCYQILANLYRYAEKMTKALFDNKNDRNSYIEGCKKDWLELILKAMEYVILRIRSMTVSDNEFPKIYSNMMEAYDLFNDVLWEYIDNYIPFSWPIEEDKVREFLSDRKRVSDLACYMVYKASLLC